ncbi:MAG: patatin-like phospholipase family protein [Hyphomicrobiaceae bacterium]|nr:patatin-like phospholipase family protein [Hyphomicrobiaceae bacterium]
MTGQAGTSNGRLRGLAGPKAEKAVSLALQGGGAHGAFTWGVLDALLEDGRLAIEAITGASAGSVNAVVLAEGWLEGGPEGAREQLRKFWQRVSLDGALSPAQQQLFSLFLGYWNGVGSPARSWLDAWASVLSPADRNPLDLNPLRGSLRDLIDFERVRSCRELKLFISATSVWTGKARIFERAELTADHVLASACLPTIFPAVEIDGEPYWDGGYVGNPPLFPLFYETRSDDILLVQLNPIERRTTPYTAQEIQNRLTEITFNANLLGELRAIEFVRRLIDSGKLSTDQYKRVRMHRISGGEKLDAFAASSRLNAMWSFLEELHELGRSAAKGWLAETYDSVGVHATLDLRAAYA